MVKAKLTQEQYGELGDKLFAQEGLRLADNSGTVQAKGVTARYAFDGQELQIQVTGHPFPLTAHYCESQIANALQEAGYTAEVVG